MDATEHQQKIRRAMEGNISAYFHPFNERVAFLYPNGNINIYDSRNWENVDVKTIRRYDENGIPLPRDELIGRADLSMYADGFDREGRVEEARA